ncbi:CLUMA_CG006049, isoform A [Clunio marinus]|uniref:Membrane-associated tyrosine- and threonine-specific cdc2-inhibitory kinase n=1 Tax=Clunio marinus TaxID=568069 RepID=A0A1J1HWU1_9DIPT|nr:CLUMA_CG006049, isoform A [Clunio marinus]
MYCLSFKRNFRKFGRILRKMFPPFKASNDFQTMHSSDIKNSSLDPTASSYFPTAKPISSTETSESFAEFLSPKPSNNPFEKNYFYENPWKSLCNEDENASLYSSGYGSEDRSVQHSPYERLTDEFCSSFSSLIKPLLSYTTQEDSYSPLTSFRFAQKSFAWECDSNEYSNSTQIESGKKFYDEIRQDFDSNGTTTDLDSVFMPSLSSTPLITRRSTFPILKAEQWQTFSSSEPIKESKSQGSSRINTKRSKPNKKSLENFKAIKMLNRSFSEWPVPEISEKSLNHSFKFNSRDESHRRIKKPPKLYPKELSFSRAHHHEVHAISFKDQIDISPVTSTPRTRNSSTNSLSQSLTSSFYDRTKNDSYFEQCFESLHKLGEGSFGEVFKVRSRDDGKLYAIKKTKHIYRSENHRRERLEEVKRCEQFSSNENCVKFYNAWEQDDLLYMQIELCRGSVEDYVEEIKNIPESFVWSFLLDMLLALKSLHDKNLIHLDIKLDNILITDENRCKLADFGLVFDLKNSPRSRAIEGDSRYLAPELLQGNYCLANDVFSLGITLLELSCNLELPANGKLWQELRIGVLPDEAFSRLSKELQTIIRSMMEPNPMKRPKVDEILKHSKLRRLAYQRKVERFSHKCVESTSRCFNSMIAKLLLLLFTIIEFFKLKESSHKLLTTPSTKFSRKTNVKIFINHDDEDSDDGEISFRTSLETSRLSKISQTDDDNNNESNVTPTLNNSVPRVTPEIKIVNSTPLNHYNHQDGLSSRKARRDLTKLSFDLTSPDTREKSKDRDSMICKKLCFYDDELSDF